MKHLMEDMSNRVTLKCSSGRFWNIELGPAIGSICLQDGWQQFLKDNSLGDREFLLFRYDGDMCFDVEIFEKNGCERIEMSVPENHQEFDLPEVKGTRYTPVTRKRGRPPKYLLAPPPLNSFGDGRGQSHLQLQQEKFEEVNKGKGILREIKDEDNFDQSLYKVDSEVKKSKEALNFARNFRTGLDPPVLIRDSYLRPCSLERLGPAEKVEEEDTVGFERVAESFSSSFPYFQMRMERSFVDRVFIMRIPSSFSRAYLRNGKTTMCLRNQQGKYWVVNCIPNGRNLSLCGGWSAFVRENYLKIGDICIFELVAKNEMLVNIVRM